ncbi:MAG: type II toxin-antitoxin system Phd/YefM family antitoxin [Bacilli bacterium]|nr:type II toxin-antitoxin system Phd/YefM family antitoxin [Bacilli bacterium]
MCYITATELKNNLNKYMMLSHEEDVYVTKNGKVVTVLTCPEDRALKEFLSLKGCLKNFDDGKPHKESLAETIEEHETIR